MPLLRRSPFSLLEPLENLDPNEQVFQIWFTKEIFRDYQYPFACHYCQLIDLYLICINILIKLDNFHTSLGVLQKYAFVLDYLIREFLYRLTLYHQKVWTCEVSGKSELTYEEALVCEQQAAVKAQMFPKELIAPVLQMIQHSRLSLLQIFLNIY
jgi:hypothetical protein